MNSAAVIVYVPADTAAASVGADDVAASIDAAITAGAYASAVQLVRPGSRGLSWLEPLVEVLNDGERVAFANVTPANAAAVLGADGAPATTHPGYLGASAAIPQLRRQTRLVFERLGLYPPTDLDAYRTAGGLAGLRAAIAQGPAATLAAVTHSGLRGRGGAAFPTGRKWQTVHDAQATRKYIVCNADEGDSGTFADRLLLEGDPYTVIEGMLIAGFAVGATEGYIYTRIEYPRALQTLRTAVASAREAGLLGADAGGTGQPFNVHIRAGAGAYICGEETALLESLEGRRGTVRFRPPMPALQGLFGKPTVVNNVISLASVPAILTGGADAYRALGYGESRGTLTVQLAGNVRRGGLFELPFGISLREVVEDLGGGTASGRPLRAIQAGGPLGAYLPTSQLDTPLDYESFKAIGAMLGHGGLVVFDDTVDMSAMARFAMEFCAFESCGKCTPCRIGAVRGTEVIDRMRAGIDRAANRALLEDLCETMIDGSLCGLGGMTPFPVQSVLRHFPEDFERKG